MTTPKQDPVDPFDVAALRATPPSVSITEHVIVQVAARKPRRQEFFQVRPDPEFTIDGTVVEFEGPNGREDFWLPPNLRHVAPEDTKAVRILTCMSKAGVVFLWPARLPSDGPGRTWYESALAVSEIAKTSWVKITGNRLAGAYEAHKATGDLGVPVWPDLDLGALLKLAFSGDRVITSPDHDVLRSLRGEL
jgi:hypothetical protein